MEALHPIGKARRMHTDRESRRMIVREIENNRSRFLAHRDSDSLERWEDASAEFFNLTGRDHPMARYARSDY